MIEAHNDIDFTDDELLNNFGFEYLLARKFISGRPLLCRKLHNIRWIRANMMTIILDLINYVRTDTKIESEEEIEAFYNSVTNALNHADIVGDNELSIASGLFFLLTSLYYKIELDYLDPEHTVENYKNNLLHWAKKYQITDVQNDSAENAIINANCIKDIFDKYISSTEQTIFMSRCFSSDYDENEHAIRRMIKEINAEKHTPSNIKMFEQIRFNGNYQKLAQDLKTRIIDYYKL